MNTDQLYEVELNFIGEQIRKKLCTMTDNEEKKKMIFDFLSMVNKDQYNFFYDMYQSFDEVVTVGGKDIRMLSKYDMEHFIKDVEENGFYLVKPPHVCVRYEAIKALYEHFDFIKPVPLYIDIFGTKKRRLIKDGIVGDMYMIILKQNSNKNFSARSTFRVNRANLPAKDITKKTNRSAYAKSPIRLSEIYNLMSSVSGADIAEFNIFTRSSVLGRKSLDRIIATDDNPLAVKKLTVKDNFINANADILNARLKSIGLKLNFVGENYSEPALLIDEIVPLNVDKYTIYDTPLNAKIYNRLFALYNEYLRSTEIIQTYIGEKQDIAWDYVFNLEEIKNMDLDDSIKETVLRVTKGEIEIVEHDSEEDDESANDEVIIDGSSEDKPIRRRRGRKKKSEQ